MQKRGYIVVAGNVLVECYKILQQRLRDANIPSSVYRINDDEWNVSGLDDIWCAVKTLQLHPEDEPGHRALRSACMPLAPGSKLLCSLQDLVCHNPDHDSFKELVVKSAAGYCLESDTAKVAGLVVGESVFDINIGSMYNVWTAQLPSAVPIWVAHKKQATRLRS